MRGAIEVVRSVVRRAHSLLPTPRKDRFGGIVCGRVVPMHRDLWTLHCLLWLSRRIVLLLVMRIWKGLSVSVVLPTLLPIRHCVKWFPNLLDQSGPEPNRLNMYSKYKSRFSLLQLEVGEYYLEVGHHTRDQIYCTTSHDESTFDYRAGL